MSSGMANDLGLDLPRHRDLTGRNFEPWVRRVGLTLLALIPLAALLNTFGQQTDESTATGPGVRLSVVSPGSVRGGLLFQARITVDATVALKDPRIVLSESWLSGLTLNTAEPAATNERWTPDGLELTFPPVPPGQRLRVFLQYQVNPTTVERTTQRVEIRDGSTPLAHVDRSFTVYP
jgi:hypothetical protein